MLDFEDREERRRARQTGNPFGSSAPYDAGAGYDAGTGATEIGDKGYGPATNDGPWQGAPQQPRINDPSVPPNLPIGNTGHSTPAPARWSRHLETMPSWLQGQSAAAQAWAKQIYDAEGDPNAELQRQISGFRQSAGSRAPGDDATVLRALATGQAPTTFSNSSPQFDDPAARLLEDYGLDRFRHLLNPDPNSGTAQLEAYLKQFADTLGQPVYSDADEAIIKTSSIDAMTRERDATRQRWLEVVQQRGMDPSSGIALDGLKEIDNHYTTLRTQVEADFARDAIGQTREQRFQRADVLGQLAGNEEGRLTEAGTYARIPLSLQDRAFGMGQQVVTGGGSPANLFSNALSFLNSQQGFQRLNQQDRAAFTQGLMEYLGYLFT